MLCSWSLLLGCALVLPAAGPRAVTGYGTGYGEYSPGPANLSRGELGDADVRSAIRAVGARRAEFLARWRAGGAKRAESADSAGGGDRNGRAVPGPPAVRGAEDAVVLGVFGEA